jgi:HAD superfamily hydrolase (TIGR01509 family)
MIRHFLFDIGNVILKFDFAIAAARLERDCDLSAAAILDALRPIQHDLEIGTLSTEAFVADAIQRIGYRAGAEAFTRALQEIFTLNDPIAELIAQLAAQNRPLYLLSNTSGLHVSHFTREYRVFDHFLGAVYSHEARLMKPDPAIYRDTSERFGIDPAETLFIDDGPGNIAAAEALGFSGIVYDYRDHGAFAARFAEVIG